MKKKNEQKKTKAKEVASMEISENSRPSMEAQSMDTSEAHDDPEVMADLLSKKKKKKKTGTPRMMDLGVTKIQGKRGGNQRRAVKLKKMKAYERAIVQQEKQETRVQQSKKKKEDVLESKKLY